ncbi:MAG TPA: hypothetical protein PK668_28230 [Myxococcota bacterium]|nr:hypothetical protein [Myxococcota bacterium]
MPERFTIEDVRRIAAQRGGRCLSKSYVNNKEKLTWRCSAGHVWQARFLCIRAGKWCPRCSKRGPRGLEDMVQLARARGGECLSKAYVSKRKRLRWRCREGHTWWATPDAIRSGRWCPRCGAEASAASRRLGIEAMRALAKARGGRCLSKIYRNMNTKLRWQCARGHTWEAVPANIKNGSWCPACAGTKRLTIGEMRQLAEERGGVCLSKAYLNANTPLEWQCGSGHRWTARPASVKRGTWCPICSNRSHSKRSPSR